jgi:hypothetical protein
VRQSIVRAGDIIFSMEKETNMINWGHRIVSAGKRVEFVSDRISYIILRSRWGNIIFLNLHSPSEEKSNGLKDFL